MTLQNSLDDFLNEQRFRGNSQKTLLYYSGSIGIFVRLLGKDTLLEDIKMPILRKYYTELVGRGLSSNTIQTYIRALRTLLTWCYQQDYVSTNLPEKFKLPKAQRKEIDVLTDTEVKALFSLFNPKYIVHLRNYCMCALMIDSGLRMNEVVTLKCSMLKISEGYCIVDGKGNKQRVVPLGMNTRRMLMRYMARRPAIAKTDYVFLMSDLHPVSISTVKQIFRKLKNTSGISRLRAHLLRHTFATRYLDNGGDMYALQQILGHTSLEMVKRYVHTTHQKIIPKFTEYSPLDNLKFR
jgi:site-specific recombinase XerD